MRATLEYTPYAWQRRLHMSKAKFKVAIVHRRGGKSVAAVMELLIQGLKSLADPSVKNVKMLYVAPTYTMAKNIAWDEIKEQTKCLPEEMGMKKTYLNGDLVFKYGTEDNNFTIHLKGSENPDTLRGLGTYYVVIDEYQDCKSDLWTKVLYPTTLDYPDTKVLFIGTPKGTNHLHSIFQSAKKKPRWETFYFPINKTDKFPNDDTLPHPRDWYYDEKFPERLEGKVITREDIYEETVNEHGPEAWEQEFMCSWTPSTRGAIYGVQMRHVRESGRLGDFSVNNTALVNTAWDIGVSDNMHVLAFQDIGGKTRIVKEWYGHGKGIDHFINEVNKWREQNGLAFGYHIAPHDIEVREASDGQTRKSKAMKLGFYFNTLKKIPIEDGIQAARTLLPSCTFDSMGCERIIEDLSLYHYEYDSKIDTFKKSPKHDRHSHGADAFRYLALGKRDVNAVDIEVIDGGWGGNPFAY